MVRKVRTCSGMMTERTGLRAPWLAKVKPVYGESIADGDRTREGITHQGSNYVLSQLPAPTLTLAQMEAASPKRDVCIVGNTLHRN
jgi:hypothetical protein